MDFPDSEYGEVNDILDKVRLFSNLRIQDYESGLKSNDSISKGYKAHASLVLIEIKRDLEHWIINRE